MDKLLTLKEATHRLRIGTRTLYQWVYLGKIEYVKIGGKLLFRESYIENFISENTIPIKRSKLLW